MRCNVTAHKVEFFYKKNCAILSKVPSREQRVLGSAAQRPEIARILPSSSLYYRSVKRERRVAVSMVTCSGCRMAGPVAAPGIKVGGGAVAPLLPFPQLPPFPFPSPSHALPVPPIYFPFPLPSSIPFLSLPYPRVPIPSHPLPFPIPFPSPPCREAAPLNPARGSGGAL